MASDPPKGGPEGIERRLLPSRRRRSRLPVENPTGTRKGQLPETRSAGWALPFNPAGFSAIVAKQRQDWVVIRRYIRQHDFPPVQAEPEGAEGSDGSCARGHSDRRRRNPRTPRPCLISN